jgi:GT2 family glycosyltransferase
VDARELWRTVAIVPIHRDEDLTHQFVEALFREPIDVVIVDNGGEYRPVAREIVLKPGTNLGWADGANYGWSYALAGDWDYFVLINNDVELSAGFFAGLLLAATQTTAGIVAPCYDGDFTCQHLPAVTCPMACEYAPRAAHRRVGYCDGTAMLVTREVASNVGLLDPTLSPRHDGGAHIDYCIRAKRCGFPIYLTEAAYCRHLGQATAKTAFGPAFRSEGPRGSVECADPKSWYDDAHALELPRDVAAHRNISVITATRRRPQALARCCEQLRQQQLDGLTVEHIIVSDGPDHEAQAIATVFGARFFVSHRLAWFRRGEAPARDVGMLHAAGDYLVFWDDDNEYFDDCLRTLHETALRGPDVGVCQTVHRSRALPPRIIPESAAQVLDFEHVDTMCLCVRREAALRVRWADCLGSIGSDFIWVNGLRQVGARFAFAPVVVGVHHEATPGASPVGH